MFFTSWATREAQLPLNNTPEDFVAEHGPRLTPGPRLSTHTKQVWKALHSFKRWADAVREISCQRREARTCSLYPFRPVGYWNHKITYLKLIHFWLHWIFIDAHGLFLAEAVGSCSLVAWESFSLLSLFSLWSAGSEVATHELSHLVACGIFPVQGWNPRPLHAQVDS